MLVRLGLGSTGRRLADGLLVLTEAVIATLPDEAIAIQRDVDAFGPAPALAPSDDDPLAYAFHERLAAASKGLRRVWRT